MNENEGQNSALQQLRESIKMQQADNAMEMMKDAIERLEKYDIPMEVPEIKEPSDSFEFDLERYQQLTRKVDALYNNYLVSKQEFIQSSDKMAIQLKELANTLDETLSESIKPRF